VDGLSEEAKNIRVTSVAVEHARIHGVRHEHIWPDTDGYLVVALTVKT
jgi:hypothetical protein